MSRGLRSVVGRFVMAVTRLVTCAGVTCTVLSWGGSQWWLLDLFSHFRLQYAAMLLAATVVFGVVRHIRSAAVALVLSGLNVGVYVPLYLSDATTEAGADARNVRILCANLFYRNNNDVPLRTLLDREQPDVIVLSEVTSAWIPVFRQLEQEYPHRLIEPRRGAFGIAVLSRLPLEGVELVEVSGGPDSETAAIVAHLGDDAGRLTVIGVHTLPPAGSWNSRVRNRQFRSLSELVRGQSRPVVVAGDLNCTSESPWFRRLLAESGLRDSRRGFGILPTWPVHRPPLWIAIDHFLVSPDVAVRGRRTGPDIGSDHFPIVCDVAVVDTDANPVAAVPRRLTASRRRR